MRKTAMILILTFATAVTTFAWGLWLLKCQDPKCPFKTEIDVGGSPFYDNIAGYCPTCQQGIDLGWKSPNPSDETKEHQANFGLLERRPEKIATVWNPWTGHDVDLYPCPRCRKPFMELDTNSLWRASRGAEKMFCPRCANGTLEVRIVGGADATLVDIHVESWTGDFGELVQRRARIGKYSDWTKVGPGDYLRETELLEKVGYAREAQQMLERLAGWNPEFKKEPTASDARSRLERLRNLPADAGRRKAAYTSLLKQLDAPRGKCHIEETDLPERYRQKRDEKRLAECLFLRDSTSRIEKYPFLKDRILFCFWTSADGSNLAAAIYEPLGPYVAISRDAGKTWTEPLYLGLHRLPDYRYLILSDSKLPAMDGDRIQLEVTVWNRDRSKPRCRFEEDQCLWKKWNRMLSIPIADLTKDSDGDGLTDLVEERILTDPESKDTDGDGYGDAVDNQPLMAFPKSIPASDQAVLALVGRNALIVYGLFDRSMIQLMRDLTESDEYTHESHLNSAGEAFYTRPSTRPVRPGDTAFVASESDVLSHLTGGQRFIVLNEEAQGRYRRKFGDEFEPVYTTMTLLLDDQESKAFLDIDFLQRDDKFGLERKGRGWLIQGLGGGIAD